MTDNDNGIQIYKNKDEIDNDLRPDPGWEEGICSDLGYYGRIITNLGGVSAVADTKDYMTKGDLENRLSSKVTGKLLSAFGISKRLFGKRESGLVDRDDITNLLVGQGFFNDRSEAMSIADEMIRSGVGGSFYRENGSDYFFREFTNTLGRKKYKLVKRPTDDWY
jgi:hypothetical protein